MSDTEVDQHLTEARRHLAAAMESKNCGTCKDILGQEITHLLLLQEVLAKTNRLVTIQDEVTESFENGARQADNAIREAIGGPNASAATTGGGPIDFIFGFIRDRPRMTDFVGGGRH
jgi:hypothetical protein